MSHLLQYMLLKLRPSGPQQGILYSHRILVSRVLNRRPLCQRQWKDRVRLDNAEAPGIIRHFANSPILHKKKEKIKKGASIEMDVRSLKTDTDTISDDPLDLSELCRGIANAVDRLTEDISKLSVRGRFNTTAIENLRVCPAKGSKKTVKLGELAQVVPKGGRLVTVLVAEEEVS